MAGWSGEFLCDEKKILDFMVESGDTSTLNDVWTRKKSGIKNTGLSGKV